MLSGTKDFYCTGAYFLTVGSTGARLDFCLHPEKIDRQGIGPSAKHRMLRRWGTGSTGAAVFFGFQLD